jgi:steroid 5-alpha reductase family enzyme
MSTIILALSVYFLLWFIGLTLIKNAGYIDIAWGLGFVLIAWTAQIVYAQPYRMGICSLSECVGTSFSLPHWKK